MDSPSLLDEDDRCGRAGFYSLTWEPPSIRPTEALRSAILHGLQDTSGADPGEVAEEKLMEIATERGLDSNQTDLLGEANHLSAIASMVTWILRPGKAWKRPELIILPNGTPWTPGAFLSADDGHLRRIVLCSRWDAYRQVQEEHDWRSLESAIYGVPMDLVVVVLGQERNGRRHGPLTKGWTHPVSKTLRFRKRDGTEFDGSWNKIFRENAEFSREQWLDALVEDGLLPEVVLIHQMEVPQRFLDLKAIADSKLSHLVEEKKEPEPQLSRCFDRMHPCQYRSCCPVGLQPNIDLGFVRINQVHPKERI